VEQQGVLNATVTLTGSSTVALARNPKARAMARADTDQSEPQYQQQQPQQQYQQPQQQYSDSGRPLMLTPQPQYFAGRRPVQQQPQQQADDGYIYPADGSSTDQRYPAPRSAQRAYNGQAYYQQQPQQQGYDVYGNPYPPRGYYQQRGYYDQN
jgi:hypothetical protein